MRSEMNSEQYILTYKTYVSFGTPDEHDTAGVKVELQVMATGIEVAIILAKKALKGLQRDNNGKNYPFIDREYELVSIEKESERENHKDSRN